MDSAGGPSGREWGNMEREVEEIRHDLRSLKVSVDYLAELVRKNESRTLAMNTKIYTTAAVVAVGCSVLGFSIKILMDFR